jgi:glycerate kinase
VTGERPVLCCPDKFRGSLTAREAADALAAGVERAGRAAHRLPLADGGEGTLDVLCPGPSDRRTARVAGPLGTEVDADWGMRGDTAVVEMARASGLALVAGANDPLRATTHGTGELIWRRARRGAVASSWRSAASATVDGGLGAPRGASTSTCVSRRRGRLRRTRRLADAARLRAAGARAAAIAELEHRLLGCRAVQGARGVDVLHLPGGGAAGGLAGGLAAYGARLVPGAELVAEIAGLRGLLEAASLALTGEGRFDATSLAGKVVGHVLQEASRTVTPAAVVAGDVARDELPAGVTCVSLVERSGSVEAAVRDASRLLTDAAASLATAL